VATVTENDLRELKDFINEKFATLKEDVTKEFTDIKITLAEVKEGQKGLSKRLDNLEFIARAVGGGVIVALLLGLAKILFPVLTI
jgi:hypothetical protein